MANPIYTGVFSSHQQLSSAQLDALVFALNNHDHGTESGGGLPIAISGLPVLNVASLIAAGLQVNTLGFPFIQTLSADPVSPVSGQIWINTSV